MSLYLVMENPPPDDPDGHGLENVLEVDLVAVTELGEALASASGAPTAGWRALAEAARALMDRVEDEAEELEDPDWPRPELSESLARSFDNETRRLTEVLKARLGEDMFCPEPLAERVRAIYPRKVGAPFWTDAAGERRFTLHPAWSVVELTREFLERGRAAERRIIVG